MDDKGQLYQTLTLITVVLIVDILERRRPGHLVNHRMDLPLNVLALSIVVVSGEMLKGFILKGLNALNIGAVFSITILADLPGALKIVLGLILVDLCLYWIHRAMHRRVLWRTHSFHHSLKELWWLSGSRTSVTHLFLFAVPQILFAYYLLKLSPTEAAVAFSIGVVVNVWIHANLKVNLGALEWLFITPNYHRVHHGTGRLSTQNLGFVLTLWDRMFGTYINPQGIDHDFALGSVPVRKRLFRMIVGL
jgi:sterol desaturase/sphingolipid hydroxylase (fatty acid hydroxylase superfamily)